MAKTDTPYDDINRSSVDKQLREATWLDGKEIVAFDTETSSGDIFMISVSGPGYTLVIDNDGESLTPERIFNTLTKKRFRGKCNVFFNLKFDASVILKVLPQEKCEKLRINGLIEYKQYEIKYIPGKFLKITDGNNHNYEYFDIAQIFGSSLSEAVDSWLENAEKNEENIDTKQFDSQRYIDKHYKSIKKYARKDAKLTRRITIQLFNEAEQNQNIPCGRPYSTGYLASQYLTQRIDHKIGYGPDKMQRMAWESYTGGRFEVFNRGQIGDIVGPDINSAYPDILSNLPDPSSLSWYGSQTQSITINDIRKADYGFIKATISTNKNKRIQPFATKINGTQTYPALDSVELTVIRDIFLFALDNGYITDYQIENVILGDTTEQTRYPFNFMPDKYSERKHLEASGNHNAADTTKITLNSMYGKTLQTIWDVLDYDMEISVSEAQDKDNIRVDRQSGIVYKEELRAGSFFNPFIGTYTTGLTRLELHKTVEELGLVDDTILFATDCIMVDKDAYDKSNFEKKLENENDSYAEQLGKWDKDYEGNAFVIGSGVYQVDTENDKQKTVSRGFGSLDESDLVKRAKNAGKEPINTGNHRPIGFSEAIHSQNLTVKDIGRFDKATKKLYADFDGGRQWERNGVTFNDLLEKQEDSKPVVYSGES